MSQLPFANLPLAPGQLESHLWAAANILRGSPVDRAGWKSYILPRLFFKRLCDVWDEKTAETVAAYGEDFLDEHRFQVPAGSHWRDVRQDPANVGAALTHALRGIEVADQTHLYGAFGDTAWSNKERLPDALLKDLIEHFSALRLGNCDVPGDAYEYLPKQFAGATNKKAGEFYTPRSVVRLMVDMLDPRAGETVYDPACGTGGMLISALDEVRRGGGGHRTLRLFDQERNHMTAAVARMNPALHGVEDYRIARGDTLERPAFTDRDRPATFDVMLANPPYSIKQWNRDAWLRDPWGRNFLGAPPQGRADYASFQHILRSLDPQTGCCAILFPHGVLFRKEEAEMRRKLVEGDWVECVLGLGPNLFYNSPMEACVIVCRARKAAERAGRVLFIDAVNEVARERSLSFLRPQHQQRIVEAYRAFADEPGFAAVATLDDIAARDFSLSIPLYVRRGGNGPAAERGLAELWAEWEEEGRGFWEEMDTLMAVLEGMTTEINQERASE